MAGQSLDDTLVLRIESRTLTELERLAVKNDRTVSQEARRALRLHLLAHGFVGDEPDPNEEEAAA